MANLRSLKPYKAKRNFTVTPEPAEGGDANPAGLQFVIQKHWASRLHYDFRLELDGVMLSWAVPKGPSFDTAHKRMAVQTEDHPISYNQFEGTIPPKQYGAGKVVIWDKGIWVPVGDPRKSLEKGDLKFDLHGHKLRGRWVLVKIKSREEKQNAWLLIKERDEFVRPASEFSVVDEMPDSVAGLPMPAGAAAPAESAESTGSLAGAKRSALPAKIAPELATLVDGPPSTGDDWVLEIKFDGYRMLARVDDSGVRLFTRNGHDWTKKLPHLARDLAAMKLPPCWLDGEIVILNGQALPDFGALQNAFDNARTKDITFHLFDLMHLDGLDLRQVPLVERRAQLQRLLEGAPDSIRFSEAFAGAPRDVVASACQLGLEGIIGKRKDSPCTSSRSPDWIKLKCRQRQEFVVAGWTHVRGTKSGIGALLLAAHDAAGNLVYAGSVGSGVSGKVVPTLQEKLAPLAAKTSPLHGATDASARGAQWVRPELVVEVSFQEWTKSGHVRHPVFHGIRTDKPAKAVVREVPLHLRPAAGGEVQRTLPAKLRVSNPERVIDSSTGVTKIELVRFYGLVGPLILEHLKNRPVSLVRAPEGVSGELFFQKHLDKGEIVGVRQLDPALNPGHAQLLEVATAQGLLSAAQQIQQAAEIVRVFLEQLELASFVKTSGGKGLHVVVPLKRLYDWDTVKDFSQAIVVHLARTLPQLFVAKSGPKNRVGRIFIDYLRNGFGATTASAWSARARPGLGVSVPIAWDELAKVTSGAHWNVRNIHTRLDKGNDPWIAYGDSARPLGRAMGILQG
ncbi:DNA ligase D [Variovorax ginsengisoli]|uniref:DNA ligase (ATP) n=1 Tax=Variovorax ginsengisoli TaxID=363844 RepID=A0ABT8SHA4_9BURK|nr:DNA ligase D [Variovorax ginsengisoli]MDN8618599.1 DNA ligase D [Variovorax ginsengisoli]MDO1537769.1 DNA ligase D [Variovorax ginsengisoli]